MDNPKRSTERQTLTDKETGPLNVTDSRAVDEVWKAYASSNLRRLADSKTDHTPTQLASGYLSGAVVRLEGNKQAGTGFIVSDGTVLTSFELVRDQEQLQASTQDGRKVAVKAIAADDIRNLARLEFTEKAAVDRPHLRLSSDFHPKAETRVAGAGYCDGRFTVSPGQILDAGNRSSYLTDREYKMLFSALHKLSAREQQEIYCYLDSQHVVADLPCVGPGSSGAPIIDANGAVVGMISRFAPIPNAKLSLAISAKELLDFSTRSSQNQPLYPIHYYSPSPWVIESLKDIRRQPETMSQVARGTIIAMPFVAGALAMSEGSVTARTMQILAGNYNIKCDVQDFNTTTDSNTKLKHGVAAAGDVSAIAGGIAGLTLPKWRSIGSGIAMLGLTARVGAEFMPHRLVYSEWHRTDGSNRPYFNFHQTLDEHKR